MLEHKSKYIHYGSDSFDIDKFEPIKNKEFGWAKPSGGFWASSTDTEWGWKQWCKAEGFCVDNLQKSFEFTLKDDARVYHIRSVYDLQSLPEWKGLFKSTGYCIDFEKAMKDWDAIELHLSEDRTSDYLNGLYFELYSWDCDSILIMNPEIIVPVMSQTIRTAGHTEGFADQSGLESAT